MNPGGLNEDIKKSNFSYLVRMYVSLHIEIFLPFMHLCAFLDVDKLKVEAWSEISSSRASKK